MRNVGQELLNVPFPEMVEQLGMSIAKAQFALDMNSVKIAQVMSGADWIDEDAEGKEVVREGLKINFGGRMLSLLELGFTPTFYQFVDTIIEVKISVSMTSETEEKRSNTTVDMNSKVKAGWGSVSASMHISTVSASFAARNSFHAEGASLIRTKLVPLPPPAVLQERIRALMEEQKKKELGFDPAVLQFEKGAGGSGTIAPAEEVVEASDELEGTPTAKPAHVSINVDADKKKMTIKPTAGAKDGVVTVTVAGKGGKKGVLKVLLSGFGS